MTEQISDSILPAIIGSSLAAVIVGLYHYRSLLEWNKIKYIFVSLFVISPGFIFQSFHSHRDELLRESSYFEVILNLPFISILSAATGIYIGNSWLRRNALLSERKKLTIVLVNSLDLHIRFIGNIFYLLNGFIKSKPSLPFLCKKNRLIELYNDSLTGYSENVNYRNFLKEISILSDPDIELISSYDKCLSLLSFECKNYLTQSNMTKALELASSLQFKCMVTLFHAAVCNVVLTKKYWGSQFESQAKLSLVDLKNLVTGYLFTTTYQSSTQAYKDFVLTLEGLKEILIKLRHEAKSPLLEANFDCFVYHKKFDCDKSELFFGASYCEIQQKVSKQYPGYTLNQQDIKSIAFWEVVDGF